ncbi:DUF4304 domain-containing protein [Caldibacillus lycopersici]|uniref:DUF4304 domain-containing protein n=1 Tax=Perspicuibacillus lycopersici TaxID=1325689 RepID=A0AAE3IWQ8_9BACI|nr:DUF4304 domain-containing protein [Perspicuibacillus lycopersici]MCU9614796.1 DUF4304 domain-containing protein [Perspicuibacillus lycopersici]
MPRKVTPINETVDNEATAEIKEKSEVENLSRMLAEVLKYLSDDEVEVIDIEYLLNHTEGLKEWWEQYRENNRKEMEEEIKKSLSKLSLPVLEKLMEQIKDNQA